jgi:hypothetical protein
MNTFALELLNSVKVLLNLTEDDSKDMLLQEIITNVYNRLLTYTGYKELPEALLWICTEVSCSRYNLLGSEGVHSELNEGIQYIYDRNLLDEYRADIDRFVELNPPTHLKRFRMM